MRQVAESLRECAVIIDREYIAQMVICLKNDLASEEVRVFVEEAIREKLDRESAPAVR